MPAPSRARLRILHAPLPLTPTTASVLQRGMDHGARIEDSNHRQTQTPERGQAVKAHHRQVAKAHQQQRGQAEADQRRITEEEQDCGKQVGKEQAQERYREQQVGMAQLRKCRAGDHRADLCERPVASKTSGAFGEFQRDATPGVLDHLRQRTVIDDVRANRPESPRASQRFGADQKATASCRGELASWIGDPDGRIELEEEKHERRDQQPLRGRGRRQPHHMRYQVAVMCLRVCDQGADARGAVTSVGIREKEVIGTEFSGGRDPLREGPQFSRPAAGWRCAPEQRKACLYSGGMGGCQSRLRGAVGAPVVDHDEVDETVECLTRERSHGGAYHRRLVPRRYDYDNASRGSRRENGCAVRRNAPKLTPAYQEICPYENRNDGDTVQAHQKVSLAMTIYGWLIFALWLTLVAYWGLAAAAVTRSTGRRWAWWREIALRLGLFALVVPALRVAVVADALPNVRLYALNNGMLIELVGFALSVLGIGLAILGRVYLGRNWGMPISNEENRELVTTGPYAFVRHPIYGGMLLAMIGSAIGQSIFWLLPLIVYGPHFILSARREEKLLIEQFPIRYRVYMKRTKMLLPLVL